MGLRPDASRFERHSGIAQKKRRAKITVPMQRTDCPGR
jgi:hypothetical protein